MPCFIIESYNLTIVLLVEIVKLYLLAYLPWCSLSLYNKLYILKYFG